MDCNINRSPSTVQNHYHFSFAHFLFHTDLGILSALNWGSLGLKAKEKILTVEGIDDSCLESSSPHKKFVFLAPQSRHSQDPSYFGSENFSNLLTQLV